MNEGLQHLTRLIDDLTRRSEERATTPLHEEDLLQQAEKETQAIKETLHSAYRSQPDRGVLRRYFKDHLASLTLLADQLTLNLRQEGSLKFDHSGKILPGDDGRSHLLYCLSKLITYTRSRFSDVTDNTLSVPLLFVSKSENTVRQHYSRIRKGLDHKKTSRAISAIILHSLHNILHPRKPLALTWSEYDFLQTFIDHLTDFAADKRRKDYHRRLMYILFRTNFNHPGLYRHLRQTFENELSGKPRKERIGKLRDALLDAEQIDLLPGLSFRHEHRSLKSFCTQWLSKRLKQEERDLKEEEIAEEYMRQNSFRLGLTVSSLGVLLHWLHHKKYIPYETFKDLAKAFVRTHSDPQGNPFKESTLAKNPDKNTLLHFYQDLRKFTEEFKEDYKL